jgi:malonyl-CoA/methylmalonyl-CoA synthetase
LSEAAVLKHVKDQLAGYKVPKRVLFLESLPRNDLGKVEKATLRRQFTNLYSLESERGNAVPS